MDQQVIDIAKKAFPDIQALMLIQSGSKYEVVLGDNSPFKDSVDIDRDLNYIASGVKVRYDIIEFGKVMESDLNCTINIFEKSLMMVTHVGDEILVMILKRNENLTEKTYHNFKEIVKEVRKIR